MRIPEARVRFAYTANFLVSIRDLIAFNSSEERLVAGQITGTRILCIDREIIEFLYPVRIPIREKTTSSWVDLFGFGQ